MRVSKYIHFLEAACMDIDDINTHSSESRREDLVAGFTSSILTEAPSSMINNTKWEHIISCVFSEREVIKQDIFTWPKSALQDITELTL